MDATMVIRERLTLMADAGATLRELVSTLDRHRDLARTEYDNLWLYCWALVRRHPNHAAASDDGTGYGEIGPG
jgi:hypothetical protein